MINISSTDKTNLLSGNPKILKLTFDGGTVLSNEQIVMEQMSITQTICDGQSFSLGSMFSSEFRTKIFNDDTTSYNGRWFNASYKVDGTSTEVRLGRFKVVSETLTDDKLYKDIVAYDALHDVLKSNYADWHNDLSFPMTVKNYRDSFFSHVGITQVSATLPNDSQTIDKTFVSENYSGSDALRYISEVTGCFGIINNMGNFRWITIKPTTYSSNIQTLSNEHVILGGLKYEEYTTNPVACVHIREVENDIGGSAGDINDGNTYYITGNPFCSGKSTEQLVTMAGNILGNINEISYTPASINCVGMPWLECGDVIRFVTDRKTVIFPIFSRSMSGISALRDAYQANGTEKFVQNVNAQRMVINQLKRKSAVMINTIEEVSTRMTEVATDLSTKYYTKTETESYVGQTADSITQTVTRNVTEGVLSDYPTTTQMNSAINQKADNITASVSQTYATKQERENGDATVKDYAESRITMTDDMIRSDVAYAVSGTDYMASYKSMTGWDKRSSTYVSVSRLSNGYFNVSSSYSGANIYGIHKCITVPAKSQTYIFRCDVQNEAYIRVVATNNSTASWVNAASSYVHITTSSTYQTSIGATSSNRYIHVYIGTLSDKTCRVKNPRLIYSDGSSELATAISSFKVQTAESITQGVTNATAGLSTRITQTDRKISTEITNRGKADGGIKSSITQLSDKINALITKNDAKAMISAGVSSGISQIKLATQNSDGKAYITLTAGSGKNKKSYGKINMGGYVRFVDMSSTDSQTTIRGGYLTSSVIRLDGSKGKVEGSKVESQITMYNGTGKTAKLIGRMDKTGLVVKNTAKKQVYVKMRASSGDIAGGVGGTQYGRIDFSSIARNRDDKKLYKGIRITADVVRINTKIGFAVGPVDDGCIYGLSADVPFVVKIWNTKKGTIKWREGTLMFRGGICIGASGASKRSIGG